MPRPKRFRRRRLASRQHQQTRTVLRLVGPLVLLTGIILLVVGVASFFSSADAMNPGFPEIGRVPITLPSGEVIGTTAPEPEPANHVWLMFVGIPLIGVGGVMCKFAYMGAVTRYVASELVPVGTDVIHDMADGTKDAVRDLAAAVKSGLREDDPRSGGSNRLCPSCGEANDADAKFCDACGEALPTSVVCGRCSQANDPDAKFCDNCGGPLQS